MPPLPVLKPQEVVRLLEGRGFAFVRQRGSHQQFRHPDGRGTTVPFHKGQDISPTLLRKIAKDNGLSAEQLLGRGKPPQAAEQRVGADELARAFCYATWRHFVPPRAG